MSCMKGSHSGTGPDSKTLSRRDFMTGAAAALLSARTSLPRALLTSRSALPQHAATTRPRVAPTFGAMIEPEDIKDSAARQIILDSCRAVVMASGVFWSSMEPKPGVLEFGRSDAVLEFASANNMSVRGHHLVSHTALPNWLLSGIDASNALPLLLGHVTTLVSHFQGRIDYWDVLNEPVRPIDHMPDMLRDSVWLRMCGPDFMAAVFREARRLDPHAKLGCNEFGIEDDSAASDVKRAAVLALLRRFTRDGVPIDYLGIESHLNGRQSFSDARIGQFIRDVRGLGLEVLITELDVDDRVFPVDYEQRDADVADVYRRFLDVALKATDVSVVTTWGLSDRQSWPQQQTPRPDGQLQRSLPFDDALKPKPAWQVLLDEGWAQQVRGGS